MAPRIRRATPADAPALAALAEASFVQAFGHLYPPEDLDAFLRGAYTVERQREVLESPYEAVWLLEDDGAAVGYVHAGPCGLPNPAVVPADGEVKRMYVLASHQSGGWGGRLMDLAEQWLLEGGAPAIWIGVWSGNHGAQRFYARRGYVQVGEHTFPVGRVIDREFTLRRGPALA